MAEADETSNLRAAVRERLRGFRAADAVRRAELRQLTEAEAARIADTLLAVLPELPAPADRGSGLVEQQRIFARARR